MFESIILFRKLVLLDLITYFLTEVRANTVQIPPSKAYVGYKITYLKPREYTSYVLLIAHQYAPIEFKFSEEDNHLKVTNALLIELYWVSEMFNHIQKPPIHSIKGLIRCGINKNVHTFEEMDLQPVEGKKNILKLFVYEQTIQAKSIDLPGVIFRNTFAFFFSNLQPSLSNNVGWFSMEELLFLGRENEYNWFSQISDDLSENGEEDTFFFSVGESNFGKLNPIEVTEEEHKDLFVKLNNFSCDCDDLVSPQSKEFSRYMIAEKLVNIPIVLFLVAFIGLLLTVLYRRTELT